MALGYKFQCSGTPGSSGCSILLDSKKELLAEEGFC